MNVSKLSKKEWLNQLCFHDHCKLAAILLNLNILPMKAMVSIQQATFSHNFCLENLMGLNGWIEDFEEWVTLYWATIAATCHRLGPTEWAVSCVSMCKCSTELSLRCTPLQCPSALFKCAIYSTALQTCCWTVILNLISDVCSAKAVILLTAHSKD